MIRGVRRNFGPLGRIEASDTSTAHVWGEQWMTSKLRNPLTLVISRLKYRQKFILIICIFLVPLVLFQTNLVANKQSDISALKGEQVGLDQLKELLPFMLLVQQHRGHVNGLLNGNKASADSIGATQQEIASLIGQIESNFRKDALPESYQAWSAVKEAWNAILGSYEQLDATLNFKNHSTLINQVQKLIISVADESGLSLDSDYHSHYMVQLVAKDLPAAIEGVGIIRGLGNGVLAAKTLTESNRATLQSQQASSKGLMDDLNKTIALFEDFKGSFVEELLESGTKTAQGINSYLSLLDIQILNKDKLNLNPSLFFDRGTAVIDSATELFGITAASLEERLQDRISLAVAQRNMTIILTVVVLLMVILFFAAFYKNVVSTVNALRERAEAMAKGDLSQDVELDTQDELQLVGIAFNDMQRALNRVLGNNQRMAETTFQSSRQLSEISRESTVMMQQVAASLEKVSEGTAAQDRATSETTKAMNEMTTGVQRIAEAASEVANLALRTNEVAELGNRQLEDSVKQMTSIKQTQAESSRIAAKLDEHSSNIGGIITTILELAKQTKLLALNANIEAARAGEHGKGFAVVAQEVGKLADQTSKSGQSIAELLNEIRSLIGEVVTAMDSMQTETNLGMESIDRSKEAIDRILDDIRKVSEQIQEVSATSEQLSAEMEEVSASIMEISGISHRTSQEAESMAQTAEEQLASMEQIQRSAQELEELSKQLREDLGMFILRQSA